MCIRDRLPSLVAHMAIPLHLRRNALPRRKPCRNASEIQMAGSARSVRLTMTNASPWLGAQTATSPIRRKRWDRPKTWRCRHGVSIPRIVAFTTPVAVTRSMWTEAACKVQRTKKPSIAARLFSCGAGSGTRTHTLLRAADFESAASTDSAIPARARSIAERSVDRSHCDDARAAAVVVILSLIHI